CRKTEGEAAKEDDTTPNGHRNESDDCKKYKIPFRIQWKEKYPWLERDESPQGKKCVICSSPIVGRLYHIQRHAISESHKKAEKLAQNTPKLNEFIASKRSFDTTTKAAKCLEVRLSCFVAEHNLPFAMMDHLNLLLKNTITDSKIIKKWQLIDLRLKKLRLCSNQYYSVIVDESTDISVSKNLAVVIRLFDKKCIDRFLDLVPLENSKNSSAETICNAILQILKTNSIPSENMLAFAADNCSVMMGSISGVQARLKKVIPNLYVNGCVCHILNLASFAADETFPKEIDLFLKNINYPFL
ncbi:uncharacterized protein LOC118732390, partial [Rhagoletis pomonella]|uniref:uncharacterized protein LOC118732390 n=1 Tax=Rhagoletis pomonella TaxID=28610 RepID=UPI001784E909